MAPKGQPLQPQPSTPSGPRSSPPGSAPASLGSKVPQHPGSQQTIHNTRHAANRPKDPTEEWVEATLSSNSGLRHEVRKLKEFASLSLTQHQVAIQSQVTAFDEERCRHQQQMNEMQERYARETSAAAAALDEAKAQQERLEAELADKDTTCMQQLDCISQMETSAESLSTAIANEQKKRATLEQERDQLEQDGNTAAARARELAEKLSHQEIAAQRELANADRAARRAHAAEGETATARAELAARAQQRQAPRDEEEQAIQEKNRGQLTRW